MAVGGGGVLYCVVARGTTVLARHASCVGNFGEISEVVLAKVKEQEQPKMTLTQGEFLFHFISQGGLVVLAITGNTPREGRRFWREKNLNLKSRENPRG